MNIIPNIEKVLLLRKHSYDDNKNISWKVYNIVIQSYCWFFLNDSSFVKVMKLSTMHET